MGFKAVDALIIAAVLVAAIKLHGPLWGPGYTIAVLVAVIVFFLVAEVVGLYRPWRGETVSRQFFQLLLVWMWTFFILLLLAYGFKSSSFYSRIAIGIWLITTPFLLSTWRIVGRRVFCYKGRKSNVVVWGSGALYEQLVATISQTPRLGLNLVEHIRDDSVNGSASDTMDPSAEPTISKLGSLVQGAKNGDFDILYIALPTMARAEIAELVDRLADSTLSVYMVPDYFTSSLAQGKWSNLEGIPLVSIYDTPFWGVEGWVKRIQDVVLSSLFLLAAAVPMLLITIAIKLSSPGPVLFKQRRYGINGKEIKVWKFRSMHVCEDEDKIPQARKDDPRITKLGALLRRTSLDELPQLINVLFGTMSIVGPRPHAIAHNKLYRKQIKGYMLRHKVRPGITGWAQINGWRGETDDLYKMEKRIEYDLWYIRNWSLWLDLKIVLLTLLYGFTGKAAY
ncbi:undecaprenyl-phosphate glucose phosphotransferase [Candidatus Thiosymbion oneisti]|uniref:undecaprenyl-phosphate glucose phosphotransferase n=1 Tax=Candidatus Thiosymbion oneisti TaxID=589554 RepID=UPI0013FD8D9A|nr:undecaprenyl-phosphate glucose phosphotransferase [Candidatus Thiosymbion oneisti]